MAADPMSEKTILAMKDVERIVYMDKEEGWAVVTLRKEDFNRLGIRWFDLVERSPGDVQESGAGNFPTAFGKPVWLELPISLNKAILSGLGDISSESIQGFLGTPSEHV